MQLQARLGPSLQRGKSRPRRARSPREGQPVTGVGSHSLCLLLAITLEKDGIEWEMVSRVSGPRELPGVS